MIVSKIWITGYWLRSQLWHVTAANQRTIVEIELLATVGWKRGLPAFQLPMYSMWDALPKKVLFHMFVSGIQESMPFVKSKPPLPTSWEPQYAPQVLHYGCFMPIPSLQLRKKKQSRAEKQRVWSRSPMLQCSVCALSCYNAVFVCGLQGHLSWHLAKSASCFHVTKATKAMNNCRDSASGRDGAASLSAADVL